MSEKGNRSTEPVLKVVDVSKSFGKVQALREVSLEIHPGEVLGLLGDNGRSYPEIFMPIRVRYFLRESRSGSIVQRNREKQE